MRLLFIGNSYTYYNDMPKLFEALARENGKEISVDSVTKGGRKLYENLDPCDENHKTILSLTNTGRYNALILQEHSLYPIKDFSAFLKGASELISLVGAERNILYATWGRKVGSSTLAELSLTSEEMTDILHEKYSAASEKLGASVSPVGLTFKALCQAMPTLELYNSDKSHPSYLGSAVAAICHYKTVFGEDAKKYTSLGLDCDTVTVILKAINSLKQSD